MAGKLLKGAFVEFMPTFLIPLPNVIIFQYNPETMTHAWTPAPPAGGANPLAVKGVPGEKLSFTLMLDAKDSIADGGPATKAIAQATGVYSRLAALEMLQYPTDSSGGGGLLGSVSASVSVGAGGISASIGGSASAGIKRPVPESQVPTVLFVWGPGRIVPVRVSGLNITEKLYDDLLNPTSAEVHVDLSVLTPDEVQALTGPLKEVAKVAYKYSQGLRQALAVANLANSAESIIGLLPV
jgi:hypothetical protein